MTTKIKAFAISLALFSAAAFAETGEKLTELDMSVLSGKKISKAYFRTQDEKKWSEIKEGQRLHRGDEIRTKSGAELVLSIGKSTVTLGPMSRMTVEQSLENGGGDSEVFLFLRKGKTFSSVSPEKKNGHVTFRITTPVATASVRGTEFIFYSDGYLECTRGCVLLSKSDRKESRVMKDSDFGKFIDRSGESREIRAGESSLIDPRGRPEPPKQAGTPEFQWKENSWGEPPDGWERRGPAGKAPERGERRGRDRPERNRDGKENAPPSAGIPPEKVPIFNK